MLSLCLNGRNIYGMMTMGAEMKDSLFTDLIDCVGFQFPLQFIFVWKANKLFLIIWNEFLDCAFDWNSMF